MKKITMMMAAAAAVVLSSCGGSSAPKANLANDVDTLCYAYGMGQSQGFKEYAFNERGLGLDSAYLDELIKGIVDGANSSSASKDAYYAGISIGQQLKNSVSKGLKAEIFGNDSTAEVSLNDFLAAFVASVKGEKTALDPNTIQDIIRTKMSEVKEKSAEKQYGEYKKQNVAFMQKKAKEAGVKQIGKTGVYYKVLTEGTGATPVATDRVKVNYEGKTIDGNVFDSSYKRNEPVELVLNQVIKGWTEALTNMKVGDVWEVYIPQEMGYGANDQGPIKPFSALTFKIELIDIIKGDAAPAQPQIEIAEAPDAQ